jgi:hypothetical protein
MGQARVEDQNWIEKQAAQVDTVGGLISHIGTG